MIYTNKLGLPQIFVDAVSVERHNKKNCVSVTTLLKGVKETVLQERHYEKLTQDVSEMNWVGIGNGVHYWLEKLEDKNTFKEEYFELQVTPKTKLTGRVDCYDMTQKLIIDWKSCAVYKIIKKDFTDWERQTILYSYLMIENGLEVEKVQIVAIMKDWKKRESKIKAGYPEVGTYIHTVNITPEKLEWAKNYVDEKIKEIEYCETLKDDEIQHCTESERWANGRSFCVMKKNQKRAVRVFTAKEDAEYMLAQMDDKHYLEERPPINTKCEDYCLVNNFCNFYKNEVAVY